MGYELRRWLADRLPDGITSGERVVALEIADQAHEATRLAYGPALIPTVLRRTGFGSAKQLGKVWEKLGANGVELRVPMQGRDGQPLKGKNGRTLYAMRGHSITFRVPTEAECPALKLPPQGDLPEASTRDEHQGESSPPGGSKDTESSPQEGTNTGESSPCGYQKLPPQGDPTTKTTQRTTTAGTKPEPKQASTKHQIADDLTNSYWERYGKGSAQGYVAVRSVIRTAIGNGVDRNECAHALDALGRDGKPVSGGTVQFALGQRKQHRSRGGARADIPTYQDYVSGVETIL